MNPPSVRLIMLCALMLLLAGCSTLPALRPLHAQSSTAPCPAITPRVSFTVVHQLTLRHAALGTSVGLGVVKFEGRTGELHAVLMTLEGLAVLEARTAGGSVQVLRALPPLNTPGVAEGLMADVAFLFLTPPGAPTEVGVDDEGNPACRWRTEDGYVVETVSTKQGGARKRMYSHEGSILREALALPPFRDGLPAETHLQVFAPAHYNLEMSLLDAERGE